MARKVDSVAWTSPSNGCWADMAIILNSAAIRNLAGPDGPATIHIRGLAKKTENRAQISAPRRTGTLARSIRTEQASDSRGIFYRVIADAPHAMSISEGSRPHIIRARNRAALFFHWQRIGRDTVVPRQGGFRTHIGRGGVLFLGKGFIDHPGTQATKWLVKALEQTVRGG